MSTKSEISAKKIIAFQEKLFAALHENGATGYPEARTDFFKAVQDNVKSNFKLWHIEDQARRVDVNDSQIAELKREIDKENQRRNDFIEKIDEILISMLPPLSPQETKSLPMNSETPGSIVDRLSIGILKIYHMNEQIYREDVAGNHIEDCKKKLDILKTQKKDLAVSFDQLLADLFSQKKQSRIYKQFKMYNDPALNPVLYEKK